jgi:membrane protein YdbS with pleckstrin-like domain
MNAETPLMEVRPSWWHYFWHLCFFWLLFIPLLVALWKRKSLLLAVYEDRIHVRRGIFNREQKDVFISDVRGVEVAQGFFQRLVGIGDIRIDTAASDDEIIARGLPRATAVRDLILGRRRALGSRG